MPRLTTFTPRTLAVLAVGVAMLCSPMARGIGAKPSAADKRAAAGALHFQHGAFEAAIAEWKEARDRYHSRKETAALIDTLGQLGAAYSALGQHRLAIEALNEAVKLARESKDDPRLAASLSSLGAANMFSREGADSEKTLREALAVSRKGKDRAATAGVLNNLGNLLAAQEKYDDARKVYGEAADAAGASVLGAKVRANLANMAVLAETFDKVPALNAAAINAAEALPDSHDKAFVLLRAGKTWEALFVRAPEHDQKRRVDALRVYEKAAKAAEASGDDRSLSFALGYAGRLYEQEKKWGEAERLTSRATFLAQKIQSPDVLYQWEWQMGRIIREQGRPNEAIEAFRRAAELLKNIRTDLSIRLGNANARSSFREAAGGVYFDLADLLLLRADGIKEEKALRECLLEARDTCEQLKTVELEDYFQDDCVNLLKKKRETIEDILQAKQGGKVTPEQQAKDAELAAATKSTAVVYIIPLRDRTETIVSMASGLHRAKAPVTAEQITETVRLFREHLEKRTTTEYLIEAWQLYDWLIRPIEGLLAKNKIDTLVFVPDGALRTIPMSSLNDKEKFLIEKFAIAVTPGLTLMEPRPIARTNIQLMASGLSASVQGYAPLPFVDTEMKKLTELFKPKMILNKDFSPDRLEKEFAAASYSILHIASHGEFSGDVKKTFVLTYDSKFTLNALEALIRPASLREQPVEMLALSACQTAAGDDRAALGLGGVAVKAGARSAFASLWFVSDQASTTLVGEFYTQLRDQVKISKAQALQRAQIKLLKDERFAHPCLWAPYLIIGNWL